MESSVSSQMVYCFDKKELDREIDKDLIKKWTLIIVSFNYTL